MAAHSPTANRRVATCVTARARMTPEQRFKLIRDYLSLGTGLGIFILQGINDRWNPVAIGACLLLMGVPLVNLRALFPGGNTNTPNEQPPSQSSESQSSSTPTSNTS